MREPCGRCFGAKSDDGLVPQEVKARGRVFALVVDRAGIDAGHDRRLAAVGPDLVLKAGLPDDELALCERMMSIEPLRQLSQHALPPLGGIVVPRPVREADRLLRARETNHAAAPNSDAAGLGACLHVPQPLRRRSVDDPAFRICFQRVVLHRRTKYVRSGRFMLCTVCGANSCGPMPSKSRRGSGEAMDCCADGQPECDGMSRAGRHARIGAAKWRRDPRQPAWPSLFAPGSPSSI